MAGKQYKAINPTGFDCVNIAVQRAIAKVKQRVRDRARASAHYKANKEGAKQKRKVRYEDTKESAKKKMSEYYQNNRGECLASMKNWRDENGSDYYKNKREDDPLFAIATRCRGRLSAFLKRAGGRKVGHTHDLVCCTWEQFNNNLKALMDGRKWKEVELDHIFPFFAFSLDEDVQKKVMHYTNLQPLTAQENRVKSTKLPTKAMAARVKRDCWPNGVTEDMLPDIYPGWATPLRMYACSDGASCSTDSS